MVPSKPGAAPRTPRPRHGRLLLAVYLLALAHVAFVFAVGEPYPSLQGPLFSGHLQRDRIVHVPFYVETEDSPSLPLHDNLLRHETLAIPAQRDIKALAPTHCDRLAREFLIGHSIRSPDLRSTKRGDFGRGYWSAWKFRVPLDRPPELIGEDDIIDD